MELKIIMMFGDLKKILKIIMYKNKKILAIIPARGGSKEQLN